MPIELATELKKDPDPNMVAVLEAFERRAAAMGWKPSTKRYQEARLNHFLGAVALAEHTQMPFANGVALLLSVGNTTESLIRK